MNGAPLPRDHGVPGPADRARLVRLRVHQVGRSHRAGAGRGAGDDADAGVRGEDASAIRLRLTAADPPLGARLHPGGRSTPRRCRCASRNGPIDGRLAYRITGIIWGGSKPTNALSIRFKSGQPWTPVDDCPLPASTLTWSLWSHTWRPDAPGRYQIVLRVDDPSIRTRRLDLFFYVREIEIDEV